MQSGEAYFGVGLRIGVTPHLGEVFPLRVTAESAQHAGDCPGRVRIAIPAGIEVVKGDTARDVHVSIRDMKHIDSEWLVFLRPVRTGQYQIRGTLSISCPNGTGDETETLLDLTMRQDTTIVFGGYPTRFERVYGGSQRFRYGGVRAAPGEGTTGLVIKPGHMVFIDRSERVLSDNVVDHPEIAAVPTVHCGKCGLAAPTEVRFFVTVGNKGDVTWVEPRPALAEEDTVLVATAKEALKTVRFVPARTKQGLAVADWAEVDVVVAP